MNHLTIYAVDTSSAEAPRGQRTTSRLMFLKKERLGSPWWVWSPSREQPWAHGAAGASRVQGQVPRDTEPTA